MRDGLKAASNRAGFFVCVDVDANAMQNLIATYRKRGTRLTYTHSPVKTCADLLSEKLEYHCFIGNNRRLGPTRVDIGLSVAANQPLAPILVIAGAGRESLAEIADEVGRRAPMVRA